MDIYGNEAYNIRQTLEKMNDTFQEILGVMKKPENRFTKVLKYIILIVGAFGLLNIIETIVKLIKGGL